MLNVTDSLNLLKLEGLPVIKTFKVDSIEALEIAVRDTGFPLVLKINSPEHKTDKGGVMVGIQSFDEAITALKKLLKISKDVVAQPQAKGLELSLGIKKDPVFNQVILFGIGGVLIELLKDISLRICPITKVEAKEMINELKSAVFLKGYRGGLKVNIDLLADLISNLSRIALRHDIKELDINPLIAKDNDLFIVDSRIKL